MSRIWLIVSSLLVLAGMFLFARPPATALILTPTPDLVAQYPRVDGSTSTQPLQMLIACKLLDVPCEWWEAFPPGTRMFGPSVQAANHPNLPLLEKIQHTGTHESYMNMIENQADLILVARAPSEDELKALADQQIELDVQPVALDGLVFLVNQQNPVEDLTLDAVRAIYTGKITNWKAVGGEDKGIQPFRRNPNSGSQELMEALVMKGTPMLELPDMELLSMFGPISMISSDEQSLGYSVYYYATAIVREERIKLLAIEGVKPAPETIATREYALTAEVYVVIRKDAAEGSPALVLRDWLLSEAGQAVVAESGYVPIQPAPMSQQ